jgi:hypothetical protein
MLFNETDKELYGKIVLILFKPFKNLEDLLGCYMGTELPWWQAYLAYKPSLSKISQNVINYLNDYHICRVNAASKHLSDTSDNLDHEEDCVENQFNIDFNEEDIYENVTNSFQFTNEIFTNLDETSQLLFPTTGFN